LLPSSLNGVLEKQQSGWWIEKSAAEKNNANSRNNNNANSRNNNKRTVCSPSPVVLTKRTRRARDFCSRKAKSSIELFCNQGSSSNVDPLPFCKSTCRSWERMRAVRRAQAFARPDCVEYKIRQAVVSFAAAAAVAAAGIVVGTVEIYV
jgi:hypothetical protein